MVYPQKPAKITLTILNAKTCAFHVRERIRKIAAKFADKPQKAVSAKADFADSGMNWMRCFAVL